MVIYMSLAIALAGLLTYVLSANVKVQEISRIAWAVGLLAFLLRVAELPSIRNG